MTSTETKYIRDGLKLAVRNAKKWFLSESIKATKQEWGKSSCIAKKTEDVVYAFFDKDNNCIYIGVTKRALKDRVHYQTSPHIKKKWWRRWKKLRVLKVPNGNDRLILELLLIMALAPDENRRPSYRDVNDAFKV